LGLYLSEKGCIDGFLYRTTRIKTRLRKAW